DDVARVEMLEIAGGALVGHDHRVSATQVGTDLGFAAHAHGAGGLVHGDDAEAVVLEGIGQAVGHGTLLVRLGPCYIRPPATLARPSGGSPMLVFFRIYGA